MGEGVAIGASDPIMFICNLWRLGHQTRSCSFVICAGWGIRPDHLYLRCVAVGASDPKMFIWNVWRLGHQTRTCLFEMSGSWGIRPDDTYLGWMAVGASDPIMFVWNAWRLGHQTRTCLFEMRGGWGIRPGHVYLSCVAVGASDPLMFNTGVGRRTSEGESGTPHSSWPLKADWKPPQCAHKTCLDGIATKNRENQIFFPEFNRSLFKNYHEISTCLFTFLLKTFSTIENI